jgi:hypothetical protein
MEDKTTHESIANTKDGAATVNQVNTLCSIYRNVLTQSITKTMKLEKDQGYLNFGKRFQDGVKGKFALHMYLNFIPANKEYTKHKVSKLISDALKLKKFDKTFAKALVKSCNDYAVANQKAS